MAMSVSPCKDCTNHRGCKHTGCKEYDEWKLESDKERALIKKNRELSGNLSSMAKNRYSANKYKR